MAMDVKGITWIGNIFQKFEDIYVEVEDAVFEMQTVGESVKKIYSEVMQDLLPLTSCHLDETSASEFPIDQYTDAGLLKKSFQGCKKVTIKADTNQTAADLKITHGVDNDVVHAESCDSDAMFMSSSYNSVKENTFISHARQYVGSIEIKSDLDGDENHQNKNMPASKTVSEISSSSELDKCRTSQSYELSRLNPNHAVTVSKSASAKVATITSVADCCNEIEKASTEEIPSVLVLAESAKEKEIPSNSYSSSVLFGECLLDIVSLFLVGNLFLFEENCNNCIFYLTGVTMVTTIQPNNYSFSYHKILVSHPEITETWGLDVPKIGTCIKQGHKTMQLDDEHKLEETCVLVTRDELQAVPNAGSNLITSKNKKWQPFSLSKKAARRQEYEKLAIFHGSNEKGKGDCAENSCPTFHDDHKKLPLPDISEPEWELL